MNWLFVVAVIGMTNIVVDSTLFEPVRTWIKSKSVFWGDVTSCHQCAGFWCGLVTGACVVSFDPLLLFACGCAGSFLASISTVLTDYLVSKTDFAVGEENG